MPVVGHVKNGVIIPDEVCDLPEDSKVWVVPVTEPSLLSAVERSRRLYEECRRIAALPMEGDDDGFSGADHDKVLYGEP